MDGVDNDDLNPAPAPATTQADGDPADAPDESQRLRAELSAATAAYREALLSANPGIPPALIEGDSVADLQASLDRARTIVAEVRRALEQPAPPVPGGSATRTRPSTERLTPFEKIRTGIG